MILKNNHGIALLITLSIITVLIAVSLELSRNARSAVMTTATARDRMTLLHMSSSGINAAMAMLVKDKKESKTDSMQEDWADPEKIIEVLNDIPFEDGNISVIISDELSRIQVNALVKFPEGRELNDPQKLMWDRCLSYFASQDDLLEEIEPGTIINSVKDWLDSGDDDMITGLNGAESDYYQTLEPPYSCGNGPMAHLDELALIRGITSDLFYGHGKRPGISGYMTIYGITDSGAYEGKVNINTAELPVLTALLSSGNEHLAQGIFDYRQEKIDLKYMHDLSSLTWYKEVSGCSDITIDSELITTSSDLFRIESAATLHKMKMTVIAVVQREKHGKTGKHICRILSWEIL
ncbi:MAG: general secretion pathway protein GspK [Desulfobacterales bacterium]|nr:general secretion pathway protein GspK [Desulfobacterales bacterium]